MSCCPAFGSLDSVIRAQTAGSVVLYSFDQSML